MKIVTKMVSGGPKSWIVAEAIAPGPVDHGVGLVADRGKEIDRCSNGDGDGETPLLDAGGPGGGNSDGEHEQGRGVVAQNGCQNHRRDYDPEQYPSVAHKCEGVDHPACNYGRQTGLLNSRSHSKCGGDDEDHVQVDRASSLSWGQNLEHNESDRGNQAAGENRDEFQ